MSCHSRPGTLSLRARPVNLAGVLEDVARNRDRSIVGSAALLGPRLSSRQVSSAISSPKRTCARIAAPCAFIHPLLIGLGEFELGIHEVQQEAKLDQVLAGLVQDL